MDKIKNTTLYKKAENMVGGGQAHHGTNPQAGNPNSPGYTGGGVQQSGLQGTTASHQTDPSYTGGVGTGAHSGLTQGTDIGGTSSGVGTGSYSGQHQGTGSGATTGGVGTGYSGQYQGSGSGAMTGGVGSGQYSDQHHGTGMGGTHTTVYPTGQEGVHHPSMQHHQYPTGGIGGDVRRDDAYPSHQGGVVGGVKGKVGNMTGSNQRADYGMGARCGTAAHQPHQTGVVGGLKEKRSNLTGSNQRTGAVQEGTMASGTVAGGGTTGGYHNSRYMPGEHEQSGYNGVQGQAGYAGVQGTAMHPGHVTGGSGHPGTHSTVDGQKPSVEDRAKELLNKMKP